MPESLILNSQSNELFYFIKELGLKPENFMWTTEASQMTGGLVVSKIIYKGTDFFFKFDLRENKHFAYYSPAEDKKFDSQYPGDWANQIYYFKKWLTCLKREIESPDLWAMLKEQKELNIFVKDEIIANVVFKPEEFVRIEKNLNEINEFLLKFADLNVENHKVIVARLDYLKESSNRIGKKDWILMLGGTTISIILDYLRDPNVVKELLKLVNRLFSWISISPPMITQ